MKINLISNGSVSVLRRPILHLANGAARSHSLAFGPLKDQRPQRLVKGADLAPRLAVAVDLL